ncbi:MAG: B12-binding domain-containing radical SAM protein [Spirochaetales bacterium]|nr:B12-binding domain-containing radical SAM protein [Spirochaetales bacterium]
MRHTPSLLVTAPVIWPNMPPIGLGFLQAHLLRHGIACDLFDMNNFFYRQAHPDLKREWLVSCNHRLEHGIFSILKKNYQQAFDQALEKLSRYPAVGFSCFKSNFGTTMEFIRLLKAGRKSQRIILGGPELARLYFRNGRRFKGQWTELADFMVVGEGETPLLEYLSGKASDKTAEFSQLPDLAVLPFPEYTGISFTDYPKRGAYPVQWSRGCIRGCRFCSERLLFRGYRIRPVDSLLEEIRYHRKVNGIKSIVFFDSLVNADYEKLNELCDRIIMEWGQVPWEAQLAIRPEMNESLLKKMKESGCYNLFVGLESGSDSVLKRMNKGYTAGEALRFFRKLNITALKFGISLITGYPGETEAEFRESLDFVIQNRGLIPKIEQVNPFTYYDGTEADRAFDYRNNPQAMQWLDIWIGELRKHNIKFIKAFIGNLVEKNG